MSDDVKLLNFIVEILTGETSFDVKRSVDERGVLLTLFIEQNLLGRVIGKNGDTANAIRNLLRQLGLKNQAHYSLRIEMK